MTYILVSVFLILEVAQSAKNWIGPIQHFPAERSAIPYRSSTDCPVGEVNS